MTFTVMSHAEDGLPVGAYLVVHRPDGSTLIAQVSSCPACLALVPTPDLLAHAEKAHPVA
jgi:hypothetical protein